MEGDHRLVRSLINISTEPITRADQSRDSGARRSSSSPSKLLMGLKNEGQSFCNAHWNQVAPLLFKWSDCVVEAHQMKPNGMNEDNIMETAPDLYETKMGKKFGLMH